MVNRINFDPDSFDPDPRSERPMEILLAETLANLPKIEAWVLWFYHAENLSFEEIGNRLGIGRRNARGVWTSGFKRLKRMSSEQGI